MKVDFRLFESGYCLADQSHALAGSPRKTIRFPASWALIRHPSQGVLLFDTGYTRRFLDETSRWPGWMYGKITPVTIPAEVEAKAQLAARGIDAAEVGGLILSHFHADHTGGLLDFPNAKVYCAAAAAEQALSLKGFQAVRRGILPGHLPANLSGRIHTPVASGHDPWLGPFADLFGDGSIRLISLPGHAAGHLGALLHTPLGEVFLLADAAWLAETVLTGVLPNPVVKLFFDSWADYTDSLRRVRAYLAAHPDTMCIPCHCQQTVARVLALQAQGQ